MDVGGGSMTNIGRVDWHGCYDGSWQGELVEVTP